MIEGLFAVSRLSPGGFAPEAGAAQAPQTAGAPQASFGEVLAGRLGQTVDALKQAEGVSIQAVTGEADTRAVADAVMSAEQSLQAAIAIRDKIVQSYLEISRMQI